MKPIKLYKVGNKIVMTLSNDKTVESAVTPYGISCANVLVGICECEGITVYPVFSQVMSGPTTYLKYHINNAVITIHSEYLDTIEKISIFIEWVREYIDNALIITEEVTV